MMRINLSILVSYYALISKINIITYNNVQVEQLKKVSHYITRKHRFQSCNAAGHTQSQHRPQDTELR